MGVGALLRQGRRQIAPVAIVPFNYVALPIALLLLDLLFAAQRGFFDLVRFEPDETIDAVLPSEARNHLVFMLPTPQTA
jgi:hypothetical protein